ncbi:MAG: flagellar hook-length control protein FliK [Gammaproteobacteria bacterium]|nr:flagellar hook-length control protein FliK [Gammaproteobacteria bacterium]
MDATLEPLMPIAAGVNGRPGALRDGVERPPGAAFGEIFTAQDAARASTSSAATPPGPAEAGGVRPETDGKNLPVAAAAVADIAADAVTRPALPLEALPDMTDASAEEALVAAAGQPAAPLTAPVAIPLTPVGPPTVAPGEAGATAAQAALPLPSTTPAPAATPTLAQPGLAQPPLAGDAPVPAPGSNATAPMPPRAALDARAAAPDPAPAALTAAAQEGVAPDQLLSDDQNKLTQPLAGAVRAAFGSPDAVALRQAPETSAAALTPRGGPPAAALFGSADQAVMPLDTQLAQGDATRLPTNLLEDFAAEQLLNRAPAQTAAAQVAQPGSFAALLPPADGDAALVAKTGVLPPLLAAPGDPAFNTELAGRVSVLLRDGLSEARLQLNPPELGRLDIKISTDGDQTRVSFLVQGAETRDVIEQAMPRLRELLEQSGLQLSRFDVADQSRSQQQGDGRAPGAYAPDSTATGEGEPASPGTTLRASTGSQSLVDFYV